MCNYIKEKRQDFDDGVLPFLCTFVALKTENINIKNNENKKLFHGSADICLTHGICTAV